MGHFARDCDITKLEESMRDIQLQLSKLKQTRQESAHSLQEYEATDEAANAYLDSFDDEEEWFLDSSASSHVTGNKLILNNLEHSNTSNIRTVGGHVMPVTVQGTIQLEGTSGEVKKVNNVLYIPGVTTNLLSVGKFTDLGHLVRFDSERCYIYECDKSNQIFLQAYRVSNKLYKIEGRHYSLELALGAGHSHQSPLQQPPLQQRSRRISLPEIDLWHNRVAHVNLQSLYHMTNHGLILGIPNIPLVKRICDSYAVAKSS
jgi:hypothetical protein